MWHSQTSNRTCSNSATHTPIEFPIPRCRLFHSMNYTPSLRKPRERIVKYNNKRKTPIGNSRPIMCAIFTASSDLMCHEMLKKKKHTRNLSQTIQITTGQQASRQIFGSVYTSWAKVYGILKIVLILAESTSKRKYTVTTFSSCWKAARRSLYMCQRHDATLKQ